MPYFQGTFMGQPRTVWVESKTGVITDRTAPPAPPPPPPPPPPSGDQHSTAYNDAMAILNAPRATGSEIVSAGQNWWNNAAKWLSGQQNAIGERLSNWTPLQRIVINPVSNVVSKLPINPATRGVITNTRRYAQDVVWDLTLGGALAGVKSVVTGQQPKLIDVLPGATQLATNKEYAKGYQNVQDTAAGKWFADAYLLALNTAQTAGLGAYLKGATTADQVANAYVRTGIPTTIARVIAQKAVKFATKPSNVVKGASILGAWHYGQQMLGAGQKTAAETARYNDLTQQMLNEQLRENALADQGRNAPVSSPPPPNVTVNNVTNTPAAEKNQDGGPSTKEVFDYVNQALSNQNDSNNALWAGLFGVLAGKSGGGSVAVVNQYAPDQGKADTSGQFGGGSGRPGQSVTAAKQPIRKKKRHAQSVRK